MKLIILRNQSARKGVFGGHKGKVFNLTARVDLEPDEVRLVDAYGAHDQDLFILETVVKQQVKVSPPGAGPFLLVRDMVEGRTYECEDVWTLLKTEGEIKEGCRRLRSLMDLFASYGREEVTEF